MLLYEFVLYISILSSLVPIFCFIYHKNNASQKIGLALFVLNLFTFLIEIFGQILIKNGFENIILSNLYVVFSPFLIYLFFLRNIRFINSFYLIKTCLFVSLILVMYNFYFFGFSNHFLKNSHLSHQLMISTISLIYVFYKKPLKSNQYLSVFNYAFLINSTLSFITILFIDIFIKMKVSEKTFMIAWSIVLLNSIVFNFVISLGIWKTKS